MKTMADPRHSFATDIHAALDWWRDAGVDCDFSDDATDWLAPLEAEKPAESAPAALATSENAPENQAPEKIDLFAGNPPADLDSFREWWLSAPGIDAIGPRGRVAPRGDAGAKLMVLVTDAEAEDRETLLSGPQGRLLSRMLIAMGFDEASEVYLASAAPRHLPMVDGSALLAAGYAEVLRHHIALVAPQKIVSFGANILPLLGHDAAQGPKGLREINHDGVTVPLLASEGLESMLAMPRLKAGFWRRWLEWMND